MRLNGRGRALAGALLLTVLVAAATFAATTILGLRAELERLAGERAAAVRAEAAVRRAWQAEVAALRAELATARRQRDEARARLARTHAQVREFAAEVRRLQTALAAAEARRVELADRAVALARDNRRLAERMVALRTARDEAARQLKGLRWRAERAEARVQALEAQQKRALAALETWLGRRREALARLFAETGLDPGAFDPAEAAGGRGGPWLPPRPAAAGEGLEALLRWLVETEDLVRRLPVVMPLIRARLTSPFGNRRDPFGRGRAFHAGIDLAGRRGMPVRAPAAGRVRFAGRRGAYGLMVELEHANGLITRFAHLGRIQVKPGQRVRRGDAIGRVGSSGRSTGPHLHYEVRVKGRAVDPFTFVEAGRDLLLPPG